MSSLKLVQEFSESWSEQKKEKSADKEIQVHKIRNKNQGKECIHYLAGKS